MAYTICCVCYRSVAVQPLFDSAFAARGTTDLAAAAAGKAGTSIFQFQVPYATSGGSAMAITGANVAPVASLGGARPASPTGGGATLKEWKAHASSRTYVLPCYYPRACAKRSVTCSQMSVGQLLDRLFCCFKKLNIHALYEPSFATFGFVLRTTEHLELSLLIWHADKARSKLYMEVDKRQTGSGCGGAFPLQYICRILKAVKCCEQTLQGNSLCLPKHQEMQSGNMGMSERCRQMDLVVTPCGNSDQAKTPASSAASTSNDCGMSFTCVGEQSLSSLETINGMMQFPVTWCHGLELLSNVSDPDKSGLDSAKIFAKVILLGVSPKTHGGSCCRGIHEQLVRLMQSLAGGAGESNDDDKDTMTSQFSTYQKDCLLQLVLTCLVNALEVRAKFSGPRSSSSRMEDSCAEAPGAGASVMDQFLESTKGVVSCDILETLLVVVRRANTKPHQAYLSVKALFLLSSQNSTIRHHVELVMATGAGTADGESTTRRCAAVLQEAQQVGTQSHGLLEAECERLSQVLQSHH